MSPSYQEQLLRRQPNLSVLMVGESDTPPKSTPDSEILCWCEERNFILVTRNRRSMPVHLAEHLAEGRHMPGILVLRLKAEMGRIIDDLILTHNFINRVRASADVARGYALLLETLHGFATAPEQL